MRRQGVLSGVAVAAVLAGGLTAWLCRPAPAPRPGPAPGPPGLSFRPGDRQAYRLRLDSTLRLAGTGQPGPRTIRQAVAGTLHLRVLDPGPEGARVALQLGPASMTLDGATSPEVDRQLGRLFVVVFAPDGAPVRFEFPPAVGEELRTVLEEVIRTFQVIVPPGATAAWSAEEVHASGRYRAAYRFTSDGRILKAKSGYVDGAPGTTGAAGMRVAVRRAEATARVDPRASWLERMVDEEELSVSMGDGLSGSSSLLARLDREPFEPPVASLLEIDEAPATYAELSASLATRGPPPPRPVRDDPGAQRRGLAELVRAIGERGETSAALTYELRDLLVRDPAAAAGVLALLRAGVPDRTAAVLLNALGMAATEEALAALRTAMGEPALGRMNRARAALALGGAPVVEEASLEALRELADRGRAEGLASTAVLALGMAGNTLRSVDSPGYPELRDELARRVAAARDGDAAAVALLAAGNTHDPDLAGAVAARLDDPSPAARAAAARALGKLGGATAAEVLARRLALEEDGTARFAIASSLNALPPPDLATLALVEAAIPRERDPQARYELARLLGANLERYPQGQATLAALSRNDPSRRIREYAAGVAWGSPR